MVAVHIERINAILATRFCLYSSGVYASILVSISSEYSIKGVIIVAFIIYISGMGGGYPCFVISVVCIGIMTALIGDVACHLGCTVGLKDSVTALAFVSLGTSLPGSSGLAAITYN